MQGFAERAVDALSASPLYTFLATGKQADAGHVGLGMTGGTQSLIEYNTTSSSSGTSYTLL